MSGTTITRRSVIGAGAVLGTVAGGAFGGPASAAPRSAPGATLPRGYLRSVGAQSDPDTWTVRPFALDQVSLDESVFTRAQQQMLHLARVYPADRMLAVFRTTAGIDTKGARPPGGWEGPGHPDEEAWGPDDYPGKSAPRANLLRGHFAGHFLSAVAQAYATTGEVELGEKLDYLVTSLGECQEALAATGRYSHPGFLAAYGEWQFSALEGYALYGEIWAPCYTAHKIMAGLLDAYRLGGSTRALEIAAGMGKWIHSRLSRCAPEQLERMWSIYIAGEYGGMNEVLADLSDITGDADFLAAARLFDLNSLVDACAANEDTLDGKHANQHIPQFLGYMKLFDYTGEQRYYDAVANFWGMVVPGRSYAHGGTGEGELWGPAGAVAGDIGERNAETCASYNMLKVSRVLFFHDQDPKYMDYYERTVLNHILGSRRNGDSDDSPEVVYMYPVHAGAERGYGNTGTCCGGTGMENHLKYQDSIYFRSAGDDALWVNLYVASTLDWVDRGVKVVQRTSFPESETSTITIDAEGPLTVNLRVPSWATAGYSVTVNGETADAAAAPGSYLALERDWTPGDVVEVTMPLRLYAEPTVDDPATQSLRVGPVTLLALSGSASWQKLSLYGITSLDGGLEEGIEPLGGNRFRLGALEFEPAYSGGSSRYAMYFERSEPVVAFGGVSSDVRNPARADASTLLDAVWAQAPFPEKGSFVRAVQRTSQEFVDEGLLNRVDRQRILVAAAKARF